MISIILPTYNGEKYLDSQISSILNQTVNFTELIIGDDCSNDKTIDIITTFANKDSRIKIIKNSKNLGFKKNIENLILNACCDYIALCDQDDIWEPEHLSILLNGIGNNYLACGNSLIIDNLGNSKNIRLSELKHFKPNSSVKDIFNFISIYQNPFQGASMLIKREFIDIALPIPDKVMYHDVWFAHLATLLNSFVYIPKIVTRYRIHGYNTSGSHNKTSRLKILIGHFIKGHAEDTNRKEVIAQLSDRVYKNNLKCPEYFDKVTNYFINENNLIGRIKNLIYEIKNHKTIYGK